MVYGIERMIEAHCDHTYAVVDIKPVIDGCVPGARTIYCDILVHRRYIEKRQRITGINTIDFGNKSRIKTTVEIAGLKRVYEERVIIDVIFPAVTVPAVVIIHYHIAAFEIQYPRGRISGFSPINIILRDGNKVIINDVVCFALLYIIIIAYKKAILPAIK